MTPYSVQEMVRKDLLHRENLGRERYGTPLYPYNGRVALVDAYEECLDLAVYLRQALYEQGIDPNKTVNPAPTQGIVYDVAAGEETHHRAARQRAEDENVPGYGA